MPLQPVNPWGSLVYQGSTSSIVTTPTDVDTYTLDLNANETITVVDTSSTLQGDVEVFDPNGNLIGDAIATAPGGTVVLQTVPVTTGGVYSIEVSGLDGTTGSVTTQVTLNAAVKSPVLGAVVGLSASYYYEGYDQPGDVAGAAAAAGTPTSTFVSTVFDGTTYNGGDLSSVQSFLGADAASLSPAPANGTLDTSYIDMTGTITVSAAEAGPATFTLGSDDGSILTIDGSQVVNDDGLHGIVTESGTVNLTAGPHSIELQYFNQSAGGVGGAT